MTGCAGGEGQEGQNMACPVEMVDVWLIFTQLIPWVKVHSHWSSSIVLTCSFRRYFTQQLKKLDKRKEPAISTTME